MEALGLVKHQPSPATLTAEEAASVEALAVALNFLGVVHHPLAGRTLITPTPVWHGGTGGGGGDKNRCINKYIHHILEKKV